MGASLLNCASAKRSLGVCFVTGSGVAKSYKKAAELFKQAAELGDSLAMEKLAQCYEKGKGINPNFTKAAEWYAKAVENSANPLRTIASLTLCYDKHKIKPDYKTVAEMYKKATDDLKHANKVLKSTNIRLKRKNRAFQLQIANEAPVNKYNKFTEYNAKRNKNK